MYERVKDSADSMMMAIVFEVGEYTSFTVISCPLIKQTSTPSGSQPLSLRARHLPLPQGTALMMTALPRGIKFYERKRVPEPPLIVRGGAAAKSIRKNANARRWG